MSKRHTVNTEDFLFYKIEELLASGPNRNNVRKSLTFVAFASSPDLFHYEVKEYELGRERYYTIEDAVRRYNEL
jgi:hypothetical protein